MQMDRLVLGWLFFDVVDDKDGSGTTLLLKLQSELVIDSIEK